MTYDIEQQIVTKYTSDELNEIIIAIESTLAIGKGLCVVSCEPRKEGKYTLHAASVLAKSGSRRRPTFTLGYTFANDDEENAFTKIKDETLSVREFIENYHDSVENDEKEYSVGILY